MSIRLRFFDIDASRIFDILTPLLGAGMAELVDAPDSKSGGGDTVSVRFRLSVPTQFDRLLFCNPFVFQVSFCFQLI